MDVELVLSFLTIEKLNFSSGDNMVESKVLANYFATSDSVQHSQRRIEILGAMPLTATGKGDNFKIEGIDELINVEYYRNVLIYISILFFINI